ncbi:hypothetical protein FOG51_02326 [Hanseniaspora uvarum]|nr:hypothetical protein FOG51_02326 [Hanseniaspora uvarum]
MSNSSFILRGTLEGHNGWVTSLATCKGDETLLVSGSRDKSIVFWKLTGEQENYGVPVKSLLGHGHIVEDVVLTSDGSFAFSASWDKSAKIWNVAEGKAITTLRGHSSDVLSVSYNEETSQVITASRDKTIKVWSVHGECLSTLLGHDDWVTSAKVIVPAKTNKNLIFSASADKVAKVCSEKLLADLKGHNGVINAVATSPDQTLIATGGKDGKLFIWNAKETQPSCSFSFDLNEEIYAIAFCSNRFFMAVSTPTGVKIIDIEKETVVDNVKPEFVGLNKANEPHAVSLEWSGDSNSVLFAGYTDNTIRVWEMTTSL